MPDKGVRSVQWLGKIKGLYRLPDISLSMFALWNILLDIWTGCWHTNTLESVCDVTTSWQLCSSRAFGQSESALYTIGTHIHPVHAKTIRKQLRRVGQLACHQLSVPLNAALPPEYFHRGSWSRSCSPFIYQCYGERSIDCSMVERDWLRVDRLFLH